jgi:hypothetical protein
MRKRKRFVITITKVAITLAIATTVIAMAASGSILISGGRNFEEGVHQVALGLMLLAYLFLIFVLMSVKKKQFVPLNVVDQGAFLLVSPCDIRDAILLTQSEVEGLTSGLTKIPSSRKTGIRIVIARQLSISESFLDVLSQFPNVTLLDMQDSKVTSEFWNNLEELPNIAHVLATNAVPTDLLRNISISLPEVRFWLDTHRRLVIGSYRAMNPGGAKS